MVILNHAIAAAMVHGAQKGLELAGDRAGAIRHYRAAAAGTANLPERDYLAMQAARLSGEAGGA